MIPKHSRQSTPLAPDQLFSAGYRDGRNGGGPLWEFQNNTDYLKGYVEGCRSIPDNTTLINFCQMPSLDSALQSIQLWEQDQKRFGFGRVALSFQNDYWIVLVSKNLHDVALPF